MVYVWRGTPTVFYSRTRRELLLFHRVISYILLFFFYSTIIIEKTPFDRDRVEKCDCQLVTNNAITRTFLYGRSTRSVMRYAPYYIFVAYYKKRTWKYLPIVPLPLTFFLSNPLFQTFIHWTPRSSFIRIPSRAGISGDETADYLAVSARIKIRGIEYLKFLRAPFESKHKIKHGKLNWTSSAANFATTIPSHIWFFLNLSLSRRHIVRFSRLRDSDVTYYQRVHTVHP